MINKLFKKICTGFLGAVILVAFSACSGNIDDSKTPNNTVEESSKKDVFNVVYDIEPVNLDPHNNTSIASFTTQRVIFDQLVDIAEDGSVKPELATKWEFTDDLTLRLNLRDDVYFSNGEKLTAEDVRYSINRATQENGSKGFFEAFDGAGCTVIDDTTIDIKLKYKFAPVFNYLASSRGDIVSKKAVEEMGKEKFARSPIGSGPFALESWTAGDNIKLVKNEKYWGNLPEYNEIMIRFISEPTNRTIELETGNADVIFNVAASDIDRISENPELKMIEGPSYKAVYLGFNQKDPITSNPKIREALVTAIDVPSLLKAVYGDSARLGTSMIEESIPGYKAMEPRIYDVEKAKKLLAEAGYADGLNVDIAIFENKDYMNIAEIVQNMWSQAGINTTISVTDLPTALDKASKGKVQISIIGLTATTGDPDHSMFVFPKAYGGWLQPNDDKVEEYIVNGKSTYDVEARKQIYYDMQDYIWEQHYILPIAFNNAYYGARSSVESFDCDPGGLPNLSETVFK